MEPPKKKRAKRLSAAGSPATWDFQTLQDRWAEVVEALADAHDIPLKRMQIQVARLPVYQEIMEQWSELDGNQRVQNWKKLVAESDRCTWEILPECIQCGDCCRRGSPTLHEEDLPILQQEKIPWDQLYTLRQGEPAHSPFSEETIVLQSEVIKIREREASRECVFLDADTNRCCIYDSRPAQCRLQSCWDATAARELAEQPHLTRQHIFANVPALLELIAEHERRCSFRQLRKGFEQLGQREDGPDGVIELLAYEDHFRHFLAEQLNIPQANLDLCFGRSLVDLVHLFGCRVQREPDGTRRLVPDGR